MLKKIIGWLIFIALGIFLTLFIPSFFVFFVRLLYGFYDGCFALNGDFYRAVSLVKSRVFDDLFRDFSGNMSSWFAALGTIGAVIVALFQESIKRLLYQPKLKLSVKNEEPWCNNVKQYNCCGYIGDALYIRIKVENVGNEVAKDIQIFAKNINPIEGIGKGKIWLEMDLQWSNTGDSYYPLIYPNTAKYCDLGFILDPNARKYDERYFFQNTWDGKYGEIDPALLMNVKYPLGGGDHILGPGKYEIEIVAAAVGAKLVKQTVVIEFNDWSQNADERMKSVKLDSKKNIYRIYYYFDRWELIYSALCSLLKPINARCQNKKHNRDRMDHL